jgi:hypothetical protein
MVKLFYGEELIQLFLKGSYCGLENFLNDQFIV